jgi:leader peptidase (prepilin peptidase)/N-methyltransferase
MGLSVVAVFLLGLLLGSFLNVCIYRLPRGMSIVRPGSACPACGHALTAADLVPVFSYLWLRGRCRYCGARISPRYPLVEVATAILAATAFSAAPHPWAAAVFALLVVLVTFIDLEHQLILNVTVIAGLVAAFALSVAGLSVSLAWALAGAALAGGLMLVIALVSRGGMGGGDVKFACVIGAFLGPGYSLLGLFLGFLAGALVGLALMASGRKGRRDAIPFGPFLAAGAFAAAVWGPVLVDAYAVFILGR